MFVEIIVICAMVIMVGWDKGVKEWFAQFEQPVLREVDITGINSPDAVLMQARGGKILGEINGEERIYPERSAPGKRTACYKYSLFMEKIHSG